MLFGRVRARARDNGEASLSQLPWCVKESQDMQHMSSNSSMSITPAWLKSIHPIKLCHLNKWYLGIEGSLVAYKSRWWYSMGLRHSHSFLNGTGSTRLNSEISLLSTACIILHDRCSQGLGKGSQLVMELTNQALNAAPIILVRRQTPLENLDLKLQPRSKPLNTTCSSQPHSLRMNTPNGSGVPSNSTSRVACRPTE